MKKIAIHSALLLLFLLTFAACSKKADNDPTPVPDENEELIIVLDAFTGLYNISITTVERDGSGQEVSRSTTDTIVVLSRINENTMEFLQYNVTFVRQDNLSELYDIRNFFILNNVANTNDHYQRMQIYRDGSRRITFTEYSTLSNGNIQTRTYEGILQ
jgi:hypothetical protein